MFPLIESLNQAICRIRAVLIQLVAVEVAGRGTKAFFVTFLNPTPKRYDFLTLGTANLSFCSCFVLSCFVLPTDSAEEAPRWKQTAPWAQGRRGRTRGIPTANTDTILAPERRRNLGLAVITSHEELGWKHSGACNGLSRNKKPEKRSRR